LSATLKSVSGHQQLTTSSLSSAAGKAHL